MLFINIFFVVVGIVKDEVFNFCSPSKLNFLNRLQGRVVQLHGAGRLFLDTMQSIAPDLLKISNPTWNCFGLDYSVLAR